SRFQNRFRTSGILKAVVNGPNKLQKHWPHNDHHDDPAEFRTGRSRHRTIHDEAERSVGEIGGVKADKAGPSRCRKHVAASSKQECSTRDNNAQTRTKYRDAPPFIHAREISE